MLRILLLLAALTLGGVTGFMVIEGWSFFDALYMSVITLSTVGYEEVHPLSTAGRVFVMAYLVLGLGVFFYGIVTLGEAVLRAQLGNWFGRRRRERAIRLMKDHFIVCGLGRMGRHVCMQLSTRRLPFVVVDRDEAVLALCEEEGWHCIVGDATEDRVLEEAHVADARGLAAVLPSDADNLYVTLSCRLLASEIQIIARASDERGVEKMKKAGANRVVSLYHTGAVKMAHFFIHPNVDQFLEVVTAQGTELDIAEIRVPADAYYAGKTLAEADFSSRGIVIVAIRRPDGSLLMPPPPDQSVDAGACLVALGRVEAIAGLSSPAP